MGGHCPAWHRPAAPRLTFLPLGPSHIAQVMEKVRSWGYKPREGGMYWSTYKASMRREGVWHRNMNEEMAEPVYRAVATEWCVWEAERVCRGRACGGLARWWLPAPARG